MKLNILFPIFLAVALAGCNSPALNSTTSPPVAQNNAEVAAAVEAAQAELAVEIGDERAEKTRIMYRMLDLVNLTRTRLELRHVELSSTLNAAAQTHSFDMSMQNRPWHFGSDGSSPLDRARRSFYPGRLLGENISESYENDFQTIVAWLSEDSTRDVLLDPEARHVGIGWYQEASGKNWWTLVMGK